MSVRLFCGDWSDYIGEIPAGSIGAIVTDPPYLITAPPTNVYGGGVARRKNKTLSVGMPWGYSLDWIDACAALRPQHWIVFANYKMLGSVLVAIQKHADVSTVFTWRKSNAPRMMGPVPRLDTEFIIWARAEGATCGNMGEFDSTVLDVSTPQAGCMAQERLIEPGSGKALHPCQKPLAVVLPFLLRLPIKTALDPFMGTGTSGVAAVRAGRGFVGIERDERWFCAAQKRIADAEAQPSLFTATDTTERPGAGDAAAAEGLFGDEGEDTR